MYDKNDPIASLITARICHDLVSPIGAIQNGLELLELAGTPPSEEFELVKQSARNANATLSFLRVAFRPEVSDAELAQQQIISLLDARYASRRMSVSWEVEGKLAQSEVALAFLMIMCFESAMPVGGHLIVRKSYPTWAFDIVADKFNFDEANWNYLTSDVVYEGSPSMVHFEMARRQFKSLDVQQDWTSLTGGHKFLMTMTKG